MEMHQLFTRQSLSRHRCQYLFTWWRKSCQSFQICLFASFTSQCYGCVLRAMRSCGLFQSWMTLRHCWHLIPGLVLPLDESLGRKGHGQSSAEPLWRLWSSNHCPWNSCHSLPRSSGHCNHSGVLCDFTAGLNKFLKFTLFLARCLGYIWSIIF